MSLMNIKKAEVCWEENLTPKLLSKFPDMLALNLNNKQKFDENSAEDFNRHPLPSSILQSLLALTSVSAKVQKVKTSHFHKG